MFLSHSCSSLFCPSIKPSVGKYCTKSNVPFSSNHPTMNGFSRKNDAMPKRNSYFTRRRHGPPSQLLVAAAASDHEDVHAGIGILEYFEGKNIFVTGATGLLGKVIVEKILRSTAVGKVYLLIKAKDKEAAVDRLKREIISSELFKCLKEKYGKCYEDFIRAKLIPVVGDIREPNLGMDYESIDAIRKDVHLIIHSAACTTFIQRYDLLVDANVIAPQRLMRFAKTSTAYVNERREGIILEEPLIMGEIGRNNNGGEQQQQKIDVADEISLLLKSSADHDATKFFKSLGQNRAEMMGWSTTYQLSKAMGEMVLNEIKGDVPLLIIRPAAIESCYREPVPG